MNPWQAINFGPLFLNDTYSIVVLVFFQLEECMDLLRSLPEKLMKKIAYDILILTTVKLNYTVDIPGLEDKVTIQSMVRLCKVLIRLVGCLLAIGDLKMILHIQTKRFEIY